MIKELLILIGLMPFNNHSKIIRYCLNKNKTISYYEKLCDRLNEKEHKKEQKILKSVNPYKKVKSKREKL